MSARKAVVRSLLVRRTLIAITCAGALAAAAQQPAGAPAGHVAPTVSPVSGVPGGPRAAAPAAPAAAPEAIALPTSPLSAATAAEIQKINEQMTLLQARLNELDLRAKIAAKQKEINGPAAEAGTQSSFDRNKGNPSVVSVAGLRGNLEAVLVFPGGVVQRVHAGDVIDDRRVAKVAINEVDLTDLKGRNVQRLAFGSSPMTRENTPLQPAAAATQPPMMPLPMAAGMPPQNTPH